MVKKKVLHLQAVAVLAGCERSCQTFLSATRETDSTVVVLGEDGPAVGAWQQQGAKVVVLGLKGHRREQFVAVRRAVETVKPDATVLWTSLRSGLLVSACHAGGSKRVVVHVGNPIRMSNKNRVAATLYSHLPNANDATLVAVSKHVLDSVNRESAFKRYRRAVVFNAVELNRFAFEPVTPTPERIKIG